MSPPSRAAISIPTRSPPRRRAAKSSASADAWSNHWKSSTRQSSPPSPAASTSRDSTPADTRNRASPAGGRGQSERSAQRVALGLGQRAYQARHRTQELVQCGERQPLLGLGPGRPQDRCPRPGGVLQQRGLPDPRLPAQHQRPAPPGAHIVHEGVDRRPFRPPAMQHASIVRDAAEWSPVVGGGYRWSFIPMWDGRKPIFW